MGVESAKAFIAKIKSDEDFKSKLSQLENGQARLDFAKAAGFDFTADDIAKAKEEQGLTDEELDGVAGGCGHVCLIIPGADIQFK
ncbi:MAG TPA: Nif11-like leader peptide family natural product precursor [Bacillota bacterium]|nr:Nif11-like leader peptide family natural product precursor [Bacillota bacterium]